MIITFIMLKLFYILLLGTIAPSLHSESDNPFVSGFYFMEKEIWMPIKGAFGFEISTQIRFRSWNVGNPKGKFIRDKPTILKPTLSSNGYLTVAVKMDNSVRCGELVHRLIAIHFISNLDNYKSINHINGIKTDNRVENLHWCNQSENLNHAIRTGLKKKTKSNVAEIETKEFIINDTVYIVSAAGLVYINGREKTPIASSGGYLYYYFDRKNQIQAQRLIAQLFISNPENKKYVSHINGVKTDNRVANLKWQTKSEICKTMIDNGWSPTSNIAGHSVTPIKIIQIDYYTGKEIKIWDSAVIAAKYFNISASTISKVLIGKNFTAAGYSWKYLNT